MLHNAFLDGKCQIRNTIFLHAHTILKVEHEKILLNFEVIFILLACYRVKAVFIYLSGENMQLIVYTAKTCCIVFAGRKVYQLEPK